MRKLGMNLMASVVICAAALTAVEAKDRKKTVTLAESVLVNGTTVEKGEYEIRFNSETSEVTFLRDGDAVLTAKADVQMRENKAPYNTLSFKQTERGRLLESLTFQGDRRVLVLGGAEASADGQ
jgi:hypothetical protein